MARRKTALPRKEPKPKGLSHALAYEKATALFAIFLQKLPHTKVLQETIERHRREGQPRKALAVSRELRDYREELQEIRRKHTRLMNLIHRQKQTERQKQLEEEQSKGCEDLPSSSNKRKRLHSV